MTSQVKAQLQQVYNSHFVPIKDGTDNRCEDHLRVLTPLFITWDCEDCVMSGFGPCARLKPNERSSWCQKTISLVDDYFQKAFAEADPAVAAAEYELQQLVAGSAGIEAQEAVIKQLRARLQEAREAEAAAGVALNKADMALQAVNGKLRQLPLELQRAQADLKQFEESVWAAYAWLKEQAPTGPAEGLAGFDLEAARAAAADKAKAFAAQEQACACARREFNDAQTQLNTARLALAEFQRLHGKTSADCQPADVQAAEAEVARCADAKRSAEEVLTQARAFSADKAKLLAARERDCALARKTYEETKVIAELYALWQKARHAFDLAAADKQTTEQAYAAAQAKTKELVAVLAAAEQECYRVRKAHDELVVQLRTASMSVADIEKRMIHLGDAPALSLDAALNLQEKHTQGKRMAEENHAAARAHVTERAHALAEAEKQYALMRRAFESAKGQLAMHMAALAEFERLHRDIANGGINLPDLDALAAEVARWEGIKASAEEQLSMCKGVTAEKGQALAAAQKAAHEALEAAKADAAEKARALAEMERACALARKVLSDVQARVKTSQAKIARVEDMYEKHWRPLLSDSAYNGTVDTSIEKQCSCGNTFMPDSAFCRKCGKHRDQVQSVTVGDAKRHIDALLPFFKSYGFDPSLLTAFVTAAGHSPSQRGQWCNMTMSELEEGWAKIRALAAAGAVSAEEIQNAEMGVHSACGGLEALRRVVVARGAYGFEAEIRLLNEARMAEGAAETALREAMAGLAAAIAALRAARARMPSQADWDKYKALQALVLEWKEKLRLAEGQTCDLDPFRRAPDDARKAEQAAGVHVREDTAALAAATQAVAVARAYQERLLAYQAMQEKLHAAQAIVSELTARLRDAEAMVQQACGQSLQAARDAVAAAKQEEQAAFAAFQKASAAWSAASTALRAAEARLGRGSTKSSSIDLICKCGNTFMADSAFCRICGTHRDSHDVTTGTVEIVNWIEKLKEAEMAIHVACGDVLESAKRELAQAREPEQSAALMLQEAAAALSAARVALQRAKEQDARYRAWLMIEEKRRALMSFLAEWESKFQHAEQAMQGACGQALEHARSELMEARAALQKAEIAEQARRVYLMKIKEYNLCLEFLEGVSTSSIKRARLS